MSLIYVVALSLVVSLDALAAGVAYGLRAIRLPFGSLAIAGAITGLCTGLALAAAHGVARLTETHVALVGGALLLIGLGLYSVAREYLSAGDDVANARKPHELKLSIGRLVISIMLRPEVADLDQSQSISRPEAVLLGLALGVDNMVATFAATLVGLLPLYTPLVMALMQMALMAAGVYASARFIPEGLRRRMPYVSGMILLLLGLWRLV